ncbi:tRNA dihydrouridine(20/20a) synthase DusA [Hyphomicrobiales bacterium BP6-180914]|uniref:tRNA-dihydrouridine(20/20a) synthase n=2 Tax=Lichenifustis flavocetrariae TaxID=2949735 RepID=A0AA41YVC1_9HYPH|nr:tRNA dihydrouridine(20/20a) synthase DusA [Lichenifustis flavocetrariae]
MMDWTDRHCRVFHRLLSRRARLYTEMVTAGAVIHGPRDRLLGFDAVEHPVAVQLGGSTPADLATAARICADYGYDEINLNVGCPSDRVKNGSFGACLMREPVLVAECVAVMAAAVALPITVKCRLGVDDQNPEEALPAMAEAVLSAGAAALIVHARKAWLQGLSPKQNRDVPPLDYALVARLKAARPGAVIGVNGGFKTVAQCEAQLGLVDGVMVGRAAYQDPEMLLSVDPVLFGAPAPLADGFAAVEAFMPYMGARLAEGVRLHDMTRHLLGLFPGLPGARMWRRQLATEAPKPGAGLDVVRAALAHVQRPATSMAA